MISPGDILDGYTLIRRIGQGGFGEVWLCRSDSMGDWRALKFIPADNGSALDKEYEALVRYRRAAAQLRSPHLTPIEHVNRCETGLFYIMQLADGAGAPSPDSPDWHPYTLGTYIAARRADAAWFTSGEVIAVMQAVLRGLQCLADAGLVHRDIKPDNILFFGGKACLGDISLMTDDRTRVTRHGTPGYSTPSWFTGGHHDMYGAAATLYTLLTGNEPDRMGRSAFMWPPQGEQSLSEAERAEWLRLHAVIRRATDEKSGERYPDFDAMAAGIEGESVPRPSSPVTGNRSVTVARIGLVFGLVGMATWHFHFGGVVIPGIAIACACYSLSVAKKTAIATILVGILGILLVMCNLGMEALTIYDQEIRKQIGKSTAAKHPEPSSTAVPTGSPPDSAQQGAILAENDRRAFRQKLMSRLEEIVTKIESVQSNAPTPAANTRVAADRVGRSPRTEEEVDAIVNQVLKRRDVTRPLLKALYFEIAPRLTEEPPPWNIPQNASESEETEYAGWKTELGNKMRFIESYGADDDAMLAVSRISWTDERYAYKWMENLLFRNHDDGPLATKANRRR